MSDNLRYRIAAVLREHVEDQLTNYDAGRNECGCGNQGLSGYVEHVADAVIAELHPQRRCQLCGRVGTQKFMAYESGWVCRSVHACELRRRNG